MNLYLHQLREDQEMSLQRDVRYIKINEIILEINTK